MPKIKINGRELEVEEGKTVLQAALENGIYIPHFCYHPHLPISGNCRMCLADIKPGPPKLSISCATVVADGMEIDTENEKVQAARRAVMEFILKNHPVDCPICDQAGECALHEYYMAYDLKPSRLLAPTEKVNKRKALKAGPTLVLDSERCILCTRCVRFMRDVVKDEQLVIVNRRDRSEITTFPGRQLDNPYSLCLADVCPVGAWTGADFRFKQRVWFLSSAPSVCPGCARGCNTWIDYRGPEVYRMRGRVNEAINKIWLCDEGRLTYHALNDDRLYCPLTNGSEAGMDEALAEAAKLIKGAGANLVFVASASLSVEEGKALLELAKPLSAKVKLHTGEPGWEDEFLRKADRNSNTKGLMDLGIKDKVEGLAPESVVVLFETLAPNPLPEGTPAPQVVLSPQASPAAQAAKVALPAASYAESAGTVVNFEGVKQEYKPAFGPKGLARTHRDLMAALAKALA